MPRASTDDFMQNFRFHVTSVSADPNTSNPVGFNKGPDGAEAGFQSVTYPEYTVGQIEYRHGLSPFPIHQPGLLSTNEISMTRGVVRLDTTFLRMIERYLERLEYRMDLTIYQFTQDTAPNLRQRQPAYNPQAARIISVNEAFVVRAKPGSDLDATSEDASMQEVDLKFEQFTVDDSRLPT